MNLYSVGIITVLATDVLNSTHIYVVVESRWSTFCGGRKFSRFIIVLKKKLYCTKKCML